MDGSFLEKQRDRWGNGLVRADFNEICFSLLDGHLVLLSTSMAVPYAFVTLLTSDYYLPGALALAAALRDIHPSPPQPPQVDFQTVCLVTPETVDVSTIKLLRRAFNLVVGVETIIQDDNKGLQLLGTFISRSPPQFYYHGRTRFSLICPQSRMPDINGMGPTIWDASLRT